MGAPRRALWVTVVVAALALWGCTSQPQVEQAAPSPTDAFVTAEDAEQAHLECMREQGFAAERHPDGGVSYDAVPDAQAEALLEADERCFELVKIDPRYSDELDDEGLRRLYRWYVAESIPCLEAEGFTGFSPPSEETFVANYYTEPWTPYFDLEDRVGPSAIDPDLEQHCPQAPGVEQLFAPRDAP